MSKSLRGMITFWRKLTRPCCDGLVLGSSQFQVMTVMTDPPQKLSLTEKFTILLNKKSILLLLSKLNLNLKYYTQYFGKSIKRKKIEFMTPNF